MESYRSKVDLIGIAKLEYKYDDNKCALIINAIKNMDDVNSIKDIITTYYSKKKANEQFDLFEVIVNKKGLNISKGINISLIGIDGDGYCGDHVIRKAAKDQGISPEMLKELGIDRSSGPNALRTLLCKIVSNYPEEGRTLILDGLTLEKYIEIKKAVDVNSIKAAASHLSDIEIELLAVHLGLNLVFLRWDKLAEMWVARARIINPNKIVTFVISNINKDGDQDHFDVGYLPQNSTWDHSKLKDGLNITKADSSTVFQETLGKEFEGYIVNIFEIVSVLDTISAVSGAKAGGINKKEFMDTQIRATIRKARRGKPVEVSSRLTDQEMVNDIMQPSRRNKDAASRARGLSLGFKSLRRRSSLGFRSPRSSGTNLSQDLETPTKDGSKNLGTYADLNTLLFGTTKSESRKRGSDSEHDNLDDTFDSSKKGKSANAPRKSIEKPDRGKNYMSSLGLDWDPEDDPDDDDSSNDDNSDGSSSDEDRKNRKKDRNNAETRSKQPKQDTSIEFLENLVMKMMEPRINTPQNNDTMLVVGQAFDAAKLKLMLKQEVTADGKILPICLFQIIEHLEKFFLYRNQETNRTHKNVPVSATFSDGVMQSTMAFFAGKDFHGMKFPGTIYEFHEAFPFKKDRRCSEAVVRAHFPENPTLALKEFRKIQIWEGKEKESVLIGPLVDRFVKSVPINIRFLERFLKLVELISMYDEEGKVLPILYSENPRTPSLITTCWSLVHDEDLFSMQACYNGDYSHVQEHIKMFDKFRDYFDVIVERLASLRENFKIVQDQLRWEYNLAIQRQPSQSQSFGKPENDTTKGSFNQITVPLTPPDPDEEDAANAYQEVEDEEFAHGFSAVHDNDYAARNNEGGRKIANTGERVTPLQT